jgi:hypothetical protein
MRAFRQVIAGGLREFARTVQDDLRNFSEAASYDAGEFRYGRQLGAYVLATPLRRLTAPPREVHRHGKNARA